MVLLSTCSSDFEQNLNCPWCCAIGAGTGLIKKGGLSIKPSASESVYDKLMTVNMQKLLREGRKLKCKQCFYSPFVSDIDLKKLLKLVVEIYADYEGVQRLYHTVCKVVAIWDTVPNLPLVGEVLG